LSAIQGKQLTQTRRAHGRPAEERIANNPTSELWGEHRSRYRFACRDVAGLRVLDIACGTGFGLQMLRQAGARVSGFDLDTEALFEAWRAGPYAPLAQADAAYLPIPDATVDLVVSFETIEHVPDAAAVAAEFRRVLRPTGRLVLSTPNRLFGSPERHAQNPFHVREFSGDELLDLLLPRFETVTIYGQWVDAQYRHVPFLMNDGRADPGTLLWKALNRLPFAVKEGLARALTGRPFYPGEADFRFVAGDWEGAHALLAVASNPRMRS
jgi:SAM-dependent methyltransferase